VFGVNDLISSSDCSNSTGPPDGIGVIEVLREGQHCDGTEDRHKKTVIDCVSSHILLGKFALPGQTAKHTVTCS